MCGGGRPGEWVYSVCVWVHVCTVHELLCVLYLLSISVLACGIPHSTHLQTEGARSRQITEKKRQREGKVIYFFLSRDSGLSHKVPQQRCESLNSVSLTIRTNFIQTCVIIPKQLLFPPASLRPEVNTLEPIIQYFCQL